MPCNLGDPILIRPKSLKLQWALPTGECRWRAGARSPQNRLHTLGTRARVKIRLRGRAWLRVKFCSLLCRSPIGPLGSRVGHAALGLVGREMILSAKSPWATTLGKGLA